MRIWVQYTTLLEFAFKFKIESAVNKRKIEQARFVNLNLINNQKIELKICFRLKIVKSHFLSCFYHFSSFFVIFLDFSHFLEQKTHKNTSISHFFFFLKKNIKKLKPKKKKKKNTD